METELLADAAAVARRAAAIVAAEAREARVRQDRALVLADRAAAQTTPT